MAVLSTSPLQILTTTNIITIEGPNKVSKKQLSSPVPVGETYTLNGKAVVIANQKAYVVDNTVTEHKWTYTSRPVIVGDVLQVDNDKFLINNGLVSHAKESLLAHPGTENNNVFHAKVCLYFRFNILVQLWQF